MKSAVCRTIVFASIIVIMLIRATRNTDTAAANLIRSTLLSILPAAICTSLWCVVIALFCAILTDTTIGSCRITRYIRTAGCRAPYTARASADLTDIAAVIAARRFCARTRICYTTVARYMLATRTCLARTGAADLIRSTRRAVRPAAAGAGLRCAAIALFCAILAAAAVSPRSITRYIGTAGRRSPYTTGACAHLTDIAAVIAACCFSARTLIRYTAIARYMLATWTGLTRTAAADLICCTLRAILPAAICTGLWFSAIALFCAILAAAAVGSFRITRYIGTADRRSPYTTGARAHLTDIAAIAARRFCARARICDAVIPRNMLAIWTGLTRTATADLICCTLRSILPVAICTGLRRPAIALFCAILATAAVGSRAITRHGIA